MSETNLSSIAPGSSAVPGAEIPETIEAPAVANTAASAPAPRPSAPEPICRPTVRIAIRGPIPSWKNPHRFDPIAGGARFVVGKTAGLFLRHYHSCFRGNSAKARRAAGAPVKRRKQARWKPVVISAVFPRGPLALPFLGFLRTCRGRPARRSRFRRPDRAG
jgi:hypothetical protein